MGVNAKEAKPTADVIEVNSMGLKRFCITFSMVSFTLSPGLCSSANSDRMWTESTTAMGIRNMGIMELIICTV